MKPQPKRGKSNHTAIIEGQPREIIGFDDKGLLLLADGERYVFQRLNFNSGAPPADEPEGVDFFGLPLLEAATVTQDQDEWSVHQGSWSVESDEAISDRRFSALRRLRGLPPEVAKTVCGIAWFEYEDGAGGWATPILLKAFRPLAPSAERETLKIQLAVAKQAMEVEASRAQNLKEQKRQAKEQARQPVTRADCCERLKVGDRRLRKLCADLRLAVPLTQGQLDVLVTKHTLLKQTASEELSNRNKARAKKRRGERPGAGEKDFEKNY